MTSSLENTFLKHLEAIYRKYDGINEDEDEGVDLSQLDRTTWIKALRGSQRPKSKIKAPQLFLFIKKKRKGNTQTRRFKFVDIKKEFENLYRIHHGNPTLTDLYWLTDNYWVFDNAIFIKR